MLLQKVLSQQQLALVLAQRLLRFRADVLLAAVVQLVAPVELIEGPMAGQLLLGVLRHPPAPSCGDAGLQEDPCSAQQAQGSRAQWA